MTSVVETPSNEDSSIILTIFFQENKVARPTNTTSMTCNQSLSVRSARSWVDKSQSLRNLTKDGKPFHFPGFEVPEGVEINPITMKLRNADFDVTLRKKELPAEVPRSATPTDKATPTDNDSSTDNATPAEDDATSTDNATTTDHATSTDNATPTDIATPNDSPMPTDIASPTANTVPMSMDSASPTPADANPTTVATPTDNATPTTDNATPTTDNATPTTDNAAAMPTDQTTTPTDKPSPATEVEEDEDSESIQVVKKDNIFSAEMTQSEMEIIQQRVARQQQQFAEYEYKEKVRKLKKVYSIFDYLTIEEMEEMLSDCKNDEDEAVVRMTEPTYLLKIRKTIACRFTASDKGANGRNAVNKMTGSQLEAYQRLLSKRSATLKKTTNEMAKKQYRLGGRLALDDALKQVQEQGMEKSTAFEGWSAARIRAYNLIDQNPNSYYYRFNAPGEIQRKGQWAPDERKLFFDRLEEVGANGQWGHFAMTIPGRVGYQCSNFYRLLVENGEVDDPNYVLDEKGKAHYLFDKKNANGTVEKTFRTHNKHGRSDPNDNGSDGVTTTTTRRKRAAPTTPTNGATATGGGTATTKRKRRTHRWGSDDDDEDDNMFADWEDNSGSYTSSTTRGTRTSSRRTRARTTTNDDEDEDMEEEFDDSTSPPPATAAAPAAAPDAAPDATIETAAEQPPLMEEDELEEEYFDATHGVPVLPGFIDPITLDEVEKPAISKYGHVMGYDSWMRCLTNWEGKRNICPLTKKPLSKRDLVVLTFDNIEEYRQVATPTLDSKDKLSYQ